MDGEFKLVSVSGDHTAVLWDVTNCELKEIDKFESHTRSVKTVAFKPRDKGNYLLTSSFFLYVSNYRFKCRSYYVQLNTNICRDLNWLRVFFLHIFTVSFWSLADIYD